jgi:ABC-type antimicrobial peptide transport system permease subunit
VFYYSLWQQPFPFATVLIETGGEPEALENSIRYAVNSVDPSQAIYDARSMDDRIAATLAGRRFTVALLALFAITAVFLAALGLYGVINYGVSQRTQEIGIRVTLGAARSNIFTLIVGQGMRITIIGIGLGWCAAFLIARLLPDQLFGVSAFDAATFGAMALLLGCVAVLASYVPARRAMNVDPVEACRHQ